MLGVEPPAFSFGGAVVGSPSLARVAIINLGTAPLDAPVVALMPGSDSDYAILHNQCENILLPAGRCDVRIQLLPSKTGDSAATLGVESSGQDAAIALAGSALSPGPLTVAPAAGSASDFGGVTIGETAEALFDISNPTGEVSGPLTISVNAAQFQLLPPPDGGCQPGATSLVNGERCRVRLAFTPVLRGGIDASLLVSSALGSTLLPLTGRGLAPASLNSPEFVDFGGVVLQSVGLRTFIVENGGDSPIELDGVVLGGSRCPQRLQRGK